MGKQKLLGLDQLAGVQEKLNRAEENTVSLNAEINHFLKDRPQNGFSEDKHEAADEWVKFHAKRGIPPRFAVLSGEIVHHLRSSLDHIGWLLSSDSYRRKHERAIAFPVETNRPITKDEIARYNRKLQGITSIEGLTLIERVQPYNAANPTDNPLSIVHELDRIDKHHNIVLVVGTFDMSIHIPRELTRTLIIGGLQMDRESFADHFASKVDLNISRRVAFADFGLRKNQTVIPAITELTSAIRGVVQMFAEL